MTSRILLFLGLGSLGLTALALYARNDRPPAPTSVSAAKLNSGQVRCEGRVNTYPGEEVVISAEYAGRVASLPVQELDLVRPGQVLARLDAREQEASLAAARARVRELEAELQFLNLEQHRQKQLVAEGAVGQRAFDDADSRLRLTQARREAAQASVAQLEAALAKLSLVAPFAGTVIERMAQPGELLPAGGRLLRLANLKRLRIEAEVDEYDLSRLRLGAPVRVEVEGQVGAVEGRVEEIPAAVSLRRLKALDPSRPTDIRVALVKIAVPATQGLKLGQRVEVSIQSN